jgi:lysosomal acid lipase/cholesteryl ester hydrolase
VWFGNTRGNTYSRRNVNGLYTYQAEFWYFSIDQLALVDLPTMIDFVLGKTGASKLAFVGHSQVHAGAWLASYSRRQGSALQLPAASYELT